MLAVSGLREEYNGLKTTITARQSPTAFSELHALLSDHDYMLGKTHAATPSITSSFAANYVMGSPSMPEAPFYGVRPSNNKKNNHNNNRYNRNNSRGNNNRGRGNGRQFDWASTQNTVYGTCNRCGIGRIPSQCPNRDPSTIRTRPSANFANTRAQSSNAFANWHSDTGANSHVTEAMDNSEAYYGDVALHVGNGKGLLSFILVHLKLKNLVQMVERQFTTKLKNVQTDWGGEFRNLASFFSSPGIIHRRSCPHTSEQNGFVERLNRHVVETGLTLLAQACVPQHFWHYAFDTAVYVVVSSFLAHLSPTIIGSVLKLVDSVNTLDLPSRPGTKTASPCDTESKNPKNFSTSRISVIANLESASVIVDLENGLDASCTLTVTLQDLDFRRYKEQ
nr:hypothetical protein [Tanacetum cinerariifolium]